MHNVDLKITGNNLDDYIVLINDKKEKIKTNQFNSLNYTCSTDAEKLNVKIFNYTELGGKLWLLKYLFYFFLSIFGIFDGRLKKNYYTIAFEADLIIKQDSKFILKLKQPKHDAQIIEVQTENEIDIKQNSAKLDEKCNKRKKILKITKILLWIATIISIVLLAIL